MRTEIAIISALALVLSVPVAFGEIVETKGQNYDLVENFFIGEAVWESHPERIMDGGWQNYALSNTGDKVIFNTNAVGSFIFDKNSCSYSIYGNGFDGEQVIPSVSAVATYLNNGQWQNLPINDEACTVTVDRYEDGVFLTSTKVITEDITEDVFISYTGTTENFYVNATNANFDLIQSSNGTNIGYYNGETITTTGIEKSKFSQEIRLDIIHGFKETFKVWHDGDEQLGISQTIHTGESITIGDQTINIAELNGQSFDRQFIIDNQAEILAITDSINYDFDTGIDSLSNINIIFDGDYKVNMDFASGDFVGYLEIDPTFTATGSVNGGNWDFDLSSLNSVDNGITGGTLEGGTLTTSQINDISSNLGSTWSTSTISESYKVHKFTSTGSSTFTITAGGGTVSSLIVGGGGAGAEGGGGGGGVIQSSSSITTGSYPVTVGAGHTGGQYYPSTWTTGGDSSFNGMTAGGGGSGGYGGSSTQIHRDGSAGDGTAGVVEGGSGSNGGGSAGSTGNKGGGGASQPNNGAIGGGGIYSDITGTAVSYGDGGGGGGFQQTNQGGNGWGGTGGGSSCPDSVVTSGTANTGGGGGGSWICSGMNGGSGIIVVRYVDDNSITATGGTVTSLTNFQSAYPTLSLNWEVPTIPQAPTGLTTVTGVPVELDWTAPTDTGNTPITGYKVFRTLNEYVYSELPNNSANSAGIDFTDNEFLTHGVENGSLEDKSTNTIPISIPTTFDTTDLHAYYKLDETSGTISSSCSDIATGCLADSTGTLSGSVTYGNTGVADNSIGFGNSGNFNSIGATTSDFGYVHQSGSLTDFTINNWYKKDTADFSTRTVFYGNVLGSSTNGYGFMGGIGADDQFTFQIMNNRACSSQYWITLLPYAPQGTTSFATPLDTDWHMVTIVGERISGMDKFHLYLDGVFQNTVTAVCDTYSTSGANYYMEIGAYRGNQEQFDGDIDELSFWKRQLSATEITELYSHNNGGTELSSGEAISTTGVIGTGLQSPDLSFTDSNLPDNTDDFSVGSWVKLDETRDSTYDGTNNGATTGVTGILGNSWSFDGSNDSVHITDDSILIDDSDITISAWVKKNADNTIDHVFSTFDSGSDSKQEDMILRIETNNQVNCGKRTSDSSTDYDKTVSSTTVTADGNWHHLVCVYDDSVANEQGNLPTDSVKLYIDGSLADNTPADSDWGITNDGTNQQYIGKSANTAHHIEAEIDQFLIYHKALSSSEVSALYNSGSGDSTPDTDGLKVHYNFEQTGNTLENQIILPPTNTKLLGLNDVTFNVGTTSASVDENTEFVEDFSSYSTQTSADTVWSTSDNNIRVNISNDNIDIYSDADGSNDSIVYDLGVGTIPDDKWKLRWDVTFSSLTRGLGYFVVGLYDSDETVSYSTNQKGIGLLWTYHPSVASADGYNIHDKDGTDNFNQSQDASQSGAYWGTGTTYYFELERLSETSYVGRTYTDDTYTTLATYNGAPSEIFGTISTGATTGLQYMGIKEYDGSYAGLADGVIDNLVFMTENEIISATGLTDNTSTPQHYAFTRDGNDWEIYQNGAQVGSTVTDSTSLGSNTGVDYTVNLDGMIDEYFINSDVLTSTEVEMAYDKGSEPTQIDTTGASVTEYDDSNVTGGNEYYYTVKATNAIGDSDFLTPFVSGLAGTPPDVPTSVSSTINSPNTNPLDITVSWSAPTNVGTGTLTGFEIYRDSVLIDTTGLVTSYTDTVPSGGGTFEYKLKSLSTHGTSGFSGTTSTTTPTVPPTPTATPTLAINNPNPSPLDIDVSWSAQSSGGSTITGYEIFRSADDITFTSVGTVTDLDFTDTVPSAGTWYYTFASTNLVGASGQSPSNSITTATVPSSPLNASSVIPSINSAPYDVTVSWDLPTSTGGSDLTGYNVYRQTGSGAFSLITTTTALGYVDTVPTALNQDYTFKIHSLNNVGESTAFVTTTITTGDVPSAPVLSFTTGTTALSWTVPSSDASITGYKVFRDGSLLTTVTTTTHSDFTPIVFGNSYDYKVVAVSSLGDSVDSNTVTTTPETEITGMIAQGITGTGAVIDWDEPAYYQGQITNYEVYYSEVTASVTTPITSAGTTTNTYSNFAPTLDYDTTYIFGVKIISPLGNSGFSNYVTVTTNVDGSIVAYDPTTGTIDWFDIDSVSEQTVNVIEFQRETQTINGTATDTLQVGYPSWWDSMTCDVDYKFAQKTEQYVEGEDMTAQVNSANANQQVIGFEFHDIDNEVIEVECAPQQSTQDDGVSATYIMTQTNLSTGMPNIPLVTQIQAFQTGEYGTDGSFGALDVVGLFVILISMVGFNRVSPIVGVLLSASLVFALSFFGIISLPTVLVGVVALVIFLAWGIQRNR